MLEVYANDVYASMAYVASTRTHPVTQVKKKATPMGWPFLLTFGGDGWNGFGPSALTLRARFARLSAGVAGLG